MDDKLCSISKGNYDSASKLREMDDKFMTLLANSMEMDDKV